jgi:type I restriction enzyme S subunit
MMINKYKKTLYRFEDFVENIREQAMPAPADSGKYIGLEHLESGSLHLKRWGTEVELKGLKFKMKKGDLLFARRNAYLRRIAIAPHDGFFSAHGMIFRPKTKLVSSDFLPFFFQSDLFMDRAIKISVGSLSPTINWGTLREQEFLLPSLEDQKIMADLLWSIDGVVEKKIALKEQLSKTYLSCLEEVYGPRVKGIKRKIKDVCRVNAKNLSSSTDPAYRFKYLDIASILAPNVIGDLKEYCFQDAPGRARRVVSSNSLVLSLVRPYFQAFVVIQGDPKDLIASTGTAVLDALDGVDYRYIFHSFFTTQFIGFCEERMNGTNYPAITPNDLKNFELVMPSFKEQSDLGQKLSKLKEIEVNLSHEIVHLNAIKKQIIKQLVG